MTVKEISSQLELSIKGVYSRIYTNKIKPSKRKGRVNLYDLNCFVMPVPYKYYPIETTVTYYIYESKMNK
jgi:hypothetical protein